MTLKSMLVAATNLAQSAVGRGLVSSLIDKDGVAVSVIIYTRNSATYLNLSLAALKLQRIPKRTWELIIVDNASQDDTWSLLDNKINQNDVQVVRKRVDERCRRSRLLNEALSIARGSIVIFLGEDRLVQPDFLLQHLIYHLKGSCIVMGDDHRCIHTHLFDPNEFSQNGIAPNPFLLPKDIDDPQRLASLVFPTERDYRSLFAYFDRRHQPVPYPWACFSISNVSLPRESIEQIGGYDEYFDGWGLEDTDLAYRLHQSEFLFHFAPRAITVRQLRPEKQGNQQDLIANIRHFFAKHSNMNSIERSLILRNNYSVI